MGWKFWKKEPPKPVHRHDWITIHKCDRSWVPQVPGFGSFVNLTKEFPKIAHLFETHRDAYLVDRFLYLKVSSFERDTIDLVDGVCATCKEVKDDLFHAVMSRLDYHAKHTMPERLEGKINNLESSIAMRVEEVAKLRAMNRTSVESDDDEEEVHMSDMLSKYIPTKIR